MEVAEKIDQFLFQTHVRHAPFAVTGPRSYYIGFEDFYPDRLGEHIKNNMMGLWFPPYRILESIYFEKDGAIMKSRDLKLSKDYRLFFFDGFEAVMFITEDRSSLVFKIKSNPAVVSGVSVHLKCNVIPIWGISPEYKWELKGIGDSPKLEINNGEMNISFCQSGLGEAKISDDEIVYPITGNGSLIISDAKHVSRKVSSNRPNKYAEFDRNYTQLITGNSELNTRFSWSKVNISWLYADYGSGLTCITGGQPEFPWFFSIDTFIALSGILSSGFFDVAHNSLDTLFTFAANQKGIMPHEILVNGVVSNSGNLEETAYMPIALWQYYNWTADSTLLKKHFDTAVKGYERLLENGLKGKGVMEDHNAGEGIDVDTVCYFINGGNRLLQINDLINGGISTSLSSRLKDDVAHWKKFLNREMWIRDENAYADRYVDGVPLLNEFWTTILPFEQGLASNKGRYERFIRSPYFENMSTREGLKVDRNGHVMPVNTGLLVNGALRYEDTETAWDFFSRNLSSFGKFSTASFPEITNNNRGCFLQAWSGALVVENVVGGFLGVTAEGGMLKVSPRMPKELNLLKVRLNNLRAGDKSYNITFHMDSFFDDVHRIQEI